MGRVFLFFMIMAIPLITYSQNNNVYNTTKVIKGRPLVLKDNSEFLNPDSFYYSLIKADRYNNHLLYFIVENKNPDSVKYRLVYISNGNLSGNSYLKCEKTDSLGHHLKGSVSLKYGYNVNVNMIYYPCDNKLLYEFPDEFNGKKINEDVVVPINFEVGIRDELVLMFANLYNSQSKSRFDENEFNPLELNFHVSLGVRFLARYKIDFRIGYMKVNEDLYGTDIGIFLMANLSNTKFYVSGGVDYLNNGKGSHGITDYANFGGSTIFYCLGVGYNLSKHISADILYYFPLYEVYGYDSAVNVNLPIDTFSKIDNGIIKFGIQYSFFY